MSEIAVSFSEQGIELTLPLDVRFPLAENEEGILLRVRRDGRAWSALEEIWADGSAEPLGPRRWRIPYERCVLLEPDLLQALGLPVPEAVDAWVESSGVPTSASFRVDVRLRHPQIGRLDPELRAGPAFVLSGDQCVLVPEKVWRLIETAERRPAEGAQLAERLRYVADCRRAAAAIEAGVDRFLERESIEVCDHVGVDVAEDPNGDLELSPFAGDIPGRELVMPNGRSRQVVTRRSSDGRVRRVVIPEDVRSKVEAIAKQSRVSGTAVPQLLTNPESVLPDGIDLSLFSRRVVGLRTRVYNSRPYVHVREGTRRGWFDVDWGVVAEPIGSSAEGQDERSESLSRAEYGPLLEEAQRTGQRFVKYRDGWLEVDPDQASEFAKVTEALEKVRGEDGRFPKNVVLEVIPNVESLEFEVQLPEASESATGPLHLDELPSRLLPSGLNAQLHRHQMIGYQWLGHLHSLGGGGLLADEMGVGKTLQIIAHFLALAERGELAPSLIVLPKTLIPNWWEEIRRFAPSLQRIVVHEGAGRRREPSYLAAAEIVLTTYETVRCDQLMLGTVDWQVVVCDEAQFVKNPTAGRTAAVKALKARQPIALTGTPVENGLNEFWCIIDYVQPGRLRSWSEFRTEFEKPLAGASEEARRPLVEKLLLQLDPHYLRRLKDEVLGDLPPKKIVQLPECEPSDLQKRLYQQTILRAREEGPGAMLAALGKLLRICAHPRCEMTSAEVPSTATLLAECPKLAQTVAILREIQSTSEKALVFAEWKEAQRILQRTIAEEVGFWPSVINGEFVGNRVEMIERFCARPGFGVMILSQHVAGYGLNIVAANHVIHYTRPWNPAKENQSTDRVHRIGQTKPVRIYFPTVRGTAEERLAELLADKQALARDVLRPSSERSVKPEELLASLVEHGDLDASERVAQ